MKEAEIEKKVCAHATERGILNFKFVSPTCRAVPDRIFFTPSGHCFLIEFKAPGKSPRPDQVRMIDKLRSQNVEVYVIDGVSAGIKLVNRYVI